MNAPAPQLRDPNAPAMRTTVRWDNLMILMIVLVGALLLFVGYLANMDSAATKPDPKAPSAGTDATTPAVVEDPDALTQLDAEVLVDEARALIAEARWVEAADRLASVPPEFAEVVGATALQTELEQLRARHEGLRASVVTAVDAERWTQARALLLQLEEIAPLDAELLAMRATVDNHLVRTTATAEQETAQEPKPKAQPTRDDVTTRGGGDRAPDHHAAGGGDTERPPAGSSQQADRPRQPAIGTAQDGDSPVAGGPGDTTGGDAGLTDAERRELEAQLNAALIDSTP